MVHLKKGNNLKYLQIELEKFKLSDYDKVIFFFDCWILTCLNCLVTTIILSLTIQKNKNSF